MSNLELIQQAKERCEAIRKEQDRIAREKQATETIELDRMEKQFRDFIYEYVGEILTSLDFEPIFEIDATNCYCKFQVCHAEISLCMTRYFHSDNSVGVLAYPIPSSIYWSNLSALKQRGASWIGHKKLLKISWELIGLIAEEYDRLLPHFQEASIKRAEEEAAQQLLAEYKQAIVKGVDASNQEIAELVEEAQSRIWTWPVGCKLEIFKIVWCRGGYWNADVKEYKLEYDFGYSLSETPNARGYYELLPMEPLGKKARQVKPPADFVTLDRLVLPCDALPEELLVKAYRQIGIIDLYDSVWTWEQPNMFLPEFFPEIPDGLPETVSNKFRVASSVDRIEIGVAPCLAIRLAVNPIDSDEGSDSSEF